MTPAQYRQALASGTSQRELDDQDDEDEAFERIRRPEIWRCLGHVADLLTAAPCKHCLRRTMISGYTSTITPPPDLVAGACALRIQA